MYGYGGVFASRVDMDKSNTLAIAQRPLPGYRYASGAVSIQPYNGLDIAQTEKAVELSETELARS